MRLFVGIPLSPAIREELERVVARTKPTLGGWRWSQPESWHITLQFLGNTRNDQYDRLLSALRGIRSPAVTIGLGGLGFFRRAGIFYADVVVTSELAALEQKVVAGTALCGFVAEARAYHPHITLARRRDPGRQSLSEDLPASPSFSPFIAREFVLYESFLGAEGSRYVQREHFPLAGHA